MRSTAEVLDDQVNCFAARDALGVWLASPDAVYFGPKDHCASERLQATDR